MKNDPIGTHKEAESVGEGRHRIEGQKGLALVVKVNGTRSFVFSKMHKGKRFSRGLGAFPAVTLKEAGKKATLLAAEIEQGMHDTGDQYSATFREAADAYIKLHKKEWKSRVHTEQWNASMRLACASIGDMDCRAISPKDVAQVVKPVWETKHETARNCLSRIAMVLKFAAAQEWRDYREPNPAAKDGPVVDLLPKHKHRVKHHPALPHAEIADFLIQLRSRLSVSAQALEFTILTACRTSEVLNATWDEIDLANALWVIPASRMKGGERHQIPLSPQAMTILEKMRRHPAAAEWIFPSGPIRRKKGDTRVQQGPKALSNMAMLQCLKGFRPDLTVHGFRSTFRDWAAERGRYPQEVCEAALAHKPPNATVAAYLRTTYFDTRRELMNDWGNYCDGIDNAPAIEVSETPEELLAKLKAAGVSVSSIIDALTDK